MIEIEKQYGYRKLRGRIIEKFGTLRAFANASSMSMPTVSRKLNCDSGFSQEDIEAWAKLLDINVAEYGDYFYA